MNTMRPKPTITPQLEHLPPGWEVIHPMAPEAPRLIFRPRRAGSIEIDNPEVPAALRAEILAKEAAAAAPGKILHRLAYNGVRLGEITRGTLLYLAERSEAEAKRILDGVRFLENSTPRDTRSS